MLGDAVQRGDSATRQLWFDVAQISMAAPTDDDRAEIVKRMRQLGIARMLYGSDGPEWNGVPPKRHWLEFASCMPLTREELDTIAGNVVPYMR